MEFLDIFLNNTEFYFISTIVLSLTLAYLFYILFMELGRRHTFKRKTHRLLALLQKKHIPRLVFFILILTYIAFQVNDIFVNEHNEWDEFYITPYIDSCTLFDLPQERAVLKFYQFCASNIIFGTPKMIPFIVSIGVLVLSFLITNRITKSQYAGLFTIAIITWSDIFRHGSTTMSFSMEWVFFLLISMYLMFSRPASTGVFYLVSLFGKGIGLLYIPVMIYFAYNNKTHWKTVALSLGTVVIIALLYTVFIGNHLVQTNVYPAFNIDSIATILYNPVWNFTQETNDMMILFFILPLSLIWTWKINRGIFVLILYTFTMQIWLPLFSEYPMGSYRMIPTIVFLGIGFGVSVQYFLLKNFHK